MAHMDIQQMHQLHELLVRGKSPSPYMKEPLPTLPEQTSATIVSDLLGPVDNAFLKSADGRMLLHSQQQLSDKQRGSETDLLSYALLEPADIERPFDDLHLQADQNQVYLQSLNPQLNGANIGAQGLPPRPYMVPSSMPGVAMYQKDATQDMQGTAAAAGMRVQVDPTRMMDHTTFVPRTGAPSPQYTVPNVASMTGAPMTMPRQFEVWDKRPYDHQQRFIKAPHHPQIPVQSHYVTAVAGAHPQHIPRASFPTPPVTTRNAAAARRIRRYSTGSIVAYPPSWADSTWHPLAMAVSSGQLANGGTGVFLPGGGSEPSAASSSGMGEEQAMNKPRRNSVAEPLYRHLEEPEAGPPKPEVLPEEWLY